MGCCGCSEEVSSKTPENEQMASNHSDQVFVTNRSCTDILAAITLVVILSVFGFLMTTVVKQGDIYRIINGYDDCAYVCGRINSANDDPSCISRETDLREEKHLQVDVFSTGIKSRKCVTNCTNSPDYVYFLNRCIQKSSITSSVSSLVRSLGLDNFYVEVVSDLRLVWRELIYLFLIALAISFGILIAFRFIVQWVIYIVMVGSVIASIGGTTYLWLAWYFEKKTVASGQLVEEDSSVQAYFIYAIIMSTVAVIITLIVLVMRKRIALVVQLFREAGKAVAAMPALLLQPVYTYLIIGIIICAWGFCMLYIESAGTIYKNSKGHFHYRKDTLLLTTRWYNLFLFFVACEFVIGCQHMVVALSVARWFFTRDKRRLSLPVVRGFCYLTMYHLGTVAFGSLLIGIVRLIRSILAFIQKRLKAYDNDCVRGILWCCQCCLWCFECALKFLTRNAYIETAIYGCGFCTGGKKAFQALSNNILRVAAINSVGDFVLFLGKVLVCVLTLVAAIFMIQKKTGLHHPWFPIAIVVLFAFVVGHSFISVYEMIIDTIFLCFCEDCNRNDGINRPYFMSRGLMEFVENSKKALRHLDESNRAT